MLTVLGTLPIPVQQAVYWGFWSSNTSTIEEIAPSCSTGNCTYPEYDSPAFCHKVANVKDKLKITSQEGRFNPHNATLPNGISLEYGVLITQINATGNLTVSTEDVGLPITAFDIIWQTNHEPSDANSTFNAFEAAFWWCVNRYKTEVVQGNRQQLSSPHLSSALSQRVAIALHTLTGLYMRLGLWKTFALCLRRLIVFSGGENFSVSNPASGVLSEFMSEKFNGAHTGSGPGFYENPIGDIALIVEPLLRAETPALVTEGINNFTRNIANSLTNS
jgi:hypothetical protein